MDHVGEWTTATIVDATLYIEGRAEHVRIKVGIVLLDGGLRIASQVVGREDELYLLPPAAAARIIGALYRGLRS